MEIYRLKWYYAVRHSGSIYEQNRLFVYDGKDKCWCLATPKRPAIGSGLKILMEELINIGYLEKTTIEDNEWVKPHINKEALAILNNCS